MKAPLLLCTLLSLPVSAQIYADLTLSLSQDPIRLELDYVNAPKTVANFITLAEGTRPWVDSTTGRVHSNTPYYNGITFHRVISGFMMQGGSQKGDGTDGPGYAFPDELDNNLSHNRAYILSMANSGPNSNGSQFFITFAPTTHLDGVHTIFGEAVSGTDVIDLVATTETNSSDQPLEDITIESITISRVGTEAEHFNEHAQNLPEIATVSACITTQDTDTILELTQPAGSTLKIGYSTNLTDWDTTTLPDQILSPSDATVQTYSTGLTITKGFFTPSLSLWPADATFPAELSGRTLTMDTTAGVITIDLSEAQTISVNGTTSAITASTFTNQNGYGGLLTIASEEFVTIYFTLGVDVPISSDLAGRLSAVGGNGVRLSGTFTVE